MAKGSNAQLDISRELSYINQKDPLFGSAIRKIVNAVNTTAKNAAVSSIGKLPAPAPIDSIKPQGNYDATTNTLTVPGGEALHYSLIHNAALQKGTQYLSEIATDPNFTAPHIIDHGASRSAFVSLPTFQNDGVTPNTYYLRSYPQYHGSDPAPPTVYGGSAGATKILLSGTTAATPLTSQGSGTAKNGSQGGQGLGKTLTRPAPRPKRSLL